MQDSMEFQVNGTPRSVKTDPLRPLLSVLRDDLNLTGTKYGCGQGQCGACTVLVDGVPFRTCVMPVRAAGGKKLTTIEGLGDEGKLHPVQQAFLDEDAMQCGYCTSGMILTAAALLKEAPNPSTKEIRTAMQGNVCRCCTYPNIIKAVRKASGKQEGR